MHQMRQISNAFEKSQNSPPLHQSVEKLSSTKLVPGAKRLGTTGVNDEGTRSQRPTSALQC